MGKTVKCEKTEVSSTKQTNDKDILNDVLLCLKTISNNYSVAISEMSSNKIYKEVYKIFDETKDAARCAYLLAFTNGWYTLEEADKTKVSKSYDTFNKQLKELA